MKHYTTLPDGQRLILIVPHDTMLRLHRLHFRGRDVRFAGNFLSYDGPEDLFQNRSLLADIKEELDNDIREGSENGKRAEPSSLFIEMEETVGWECTDAADKYDLDALEPFKPNAKSRGLRVKPCRTDLRAPQTRGITFVYFLKRHLPRTWLTFFWSIRPGEDLGELRGDVTRRERRIFFDYAHPGQ